MGWLLDTNVVIDAFAGQPAAVRALAKARSTSVDWVGFSAMTRLEVLGFRGLSAADEKGLRELLGQFREVPISPEIIDEAIRIRREAAIKIPDAIIAATALVQNVAVVTRNVTDFRKVSGLQIIDPQTQ